MGTWGIIFENLILRPITLRKLSTKLYLFLFHMTSFFHNGASNFFLKFCFRSQLFTITALILHLFIAYYMLNQQPGLTLTRLFLFIIHKEETTLLKRKFI